MSNKREICYENITEDLIKYGDTNREKIEYPKSSKSTCTICGGSGLVRPAWLKDHEASLDCPACRVIE